MRRRRTREFRWPARSAGRFGRGAHPQSSFATNPQTDQAPPFRTARPSGGKCERGHSPFHKTTATNRNSPQCAYSAPGSFDSRRGAPGGSEGGARLPTRSRSHRNPAEDAPPLPDRSTKCCWGRFADCEKTGGSELVRCPRDRGASVKGGTPPFTRRQRRIGTRRSARTAHQGVSIPGAERRGVRKGGRASQPDHAPTVIPLRMRLPCRTARPSAVGGASLTARKQVAAN